jgi:hypothetical protein
VAPTAADATLSTALVGGSGTSVVLSNVQTWTTTPAAGQQLVIVDGNKTEQLTISAGGWNSGTSTATVSASPVNSHAVGTYCYFQAAATPSPAFVSVTKIDAQDNIAMLGDKGFRGSMASEYGVQQGMRIGKLSFDADFFPDAAGYFLNSLFGNYSGAVSSGSNPATYNFSQANSSPSNTPGQPAPLLVYVYQPQSTTTRVFARAVVSDFTLKVDPGALMGYTCTLMSFASGIVTSPATVPPTFSTFTPVASRVATVSMGGNATAKVLSAEYAWKRDSAGEINTLQGLQDPLSIFVGTLDLSIKIKLVPNDDTETNYFLNGTQNGITLTATQGTSTAGNGVVVQCTSVNYNDANITRDKAYVEVDLDIDALANTTDRVGSTGYSPSKVTLTTGTAGTATQYGAV